jgi:hypothetical protein
MAERIRVRLRENEVARVRITEARRRVLGIVNAEGARRGLFGARPLNRRSTAGD